MSEAAVALGLPHGAYPERPDPPKSWLDEQGRRLGGAVGRAWRGRIRGADELLASIESHGQSLGQLDLDGLLEVARGLRLELRGGGLATDAVARSFALVREVADRTLGQRHFDVQLIGGWVLLYGMVAEMEAGI